MLVKETALTRPLRAGVGAPKIGCIEMISNMTGSIDCEVTPRQEWLEASAASWLSLAAAPTFAIVALLTGIHDGSMPDMLCSDMQDASPLTGMVPMYLLMSAFHLAPWLRLFSHRRRVTADRRATFCAARADGTLSPLRGP